MTQDPLIDGLLSKFAKTFYTFRISLESGQECPDYRLVLLFTDHDRRDIPVPSALAESLEAFRKLA